MSIDILMPALSPTMEEGTLAKWLVKEGDTVSSGDIIAEIETDKATMEVEAVDEGVVAKLMVAEGTEGVAVNAVIAVLAEEGEDASTATAKAPTAPTPAPTPAEPVVVEAPEHRTQEGCAKKVDTCHVQVDTARLTLNSQVELQPGPLCWRYEESWCKVGQK